VTTVHNELQDDPTIEGAVARALATDPRLHLSTTTIQIKSFNGRVILSGPVLNQAQQLAGEAVTRSVPGVIDVANRLVVRPERNGRAG
jgi:osmotically-inducible protein OsmY